MPRAAVGQQSSLGVGLGGARSLGPLPSAPQGGSNPYGSRTALYAPPTRAAVNRPAPTPVGGSRGAGLGGTGRVAGIPGARRAIGGGTQPGAALTPGAAGPPVAGVATERAVAPSSVPVGSALAAAAHGRRSSLPLSREGGAPWPGAAVRGAEPPASVAPSPQRMREAGKLIPGKAKSSESDYTIVFDLDETLVSNRMPGFRPAIKRPHLEPLLRSLKGKAEIVLWTASIESVGKPVLRQIDPNGEFFDHAIYRNPQWFSERPMAPHHKDLRLLGRDMNKVIIVENNPLSVRTNKRNAILLPDFDKPNPSDSSLRNLESFLGQLCTSGKDVTEYVPNSHNVQPMRMVRPYGAYSTGIGRPGAAAGSKAQEPFYYLNQNRPVGA